MTLKGYRSHVINVLTGLALILASPAVLDIIPAAWLPYVPAVSAVIAVVMRQITTTPVGQS